MSPRLLARQVDLGGAARRDRLRQGLHDVLREVDGTAPGAAPTADLLARLEQALHRPEPEHVWLALAVLSGRLPVTDDVLRVTRAARLDGPLRALTSALVLGGRRRVELVTGEVLVDLHHTARTHLATGIQRVARETTARWHRDHAPRLLRWDGSLRSLAELSAAERVAALSADAAPAPAPPEAAAVVPWRATYLVPELAAEPARARRLQALTTFAGCRTGLIGFDCVPVTSGETVRAGMASSFAGMLAAAARADHLAAISEAAAVEYRGWRAMLPGAGLTGPRVHAVRLPTEVAAPSPEAVAAARAELLTPGLPMVLCVGSHEPRKNHLAVLHAAERLWDRGLAFSLVLVGGNSWRSEAFTAEADRLAAAGHSLRLVRGLSDEALMAAYVLARCTVFPSLNEGFGLPVAESLTLGTPVVTSDFGSMREIAEDGGGALLVDPRSDDELTDALRRLLTDDALHARLSAQALGRPVSTWDDYAAGTWAALTGS